jgi:hypothetical protein
MMRQSVTIGVTPLKRRILDSDGWIGSLTRPGDRRIAKELQSAWTAVDIY